jgi:NADH-quinone oxidoreductase subunit N
LAAIAQTNVKRMLAFSTISQMGFVLLGIMSGVVNGDALRLLPMPTVLPCFMW